MGLMSNYYLISIILITLLPFLVNPMISQLYLYPNGYGVVVFVGLMFAAIICYICMFVAYN